MASSRLVRVTVWLRRSSVSWLAASAERSNVSSIPRSASAVERPLHHLPARVAEHNEVTGEVSAVDRRDVPRLERPEVARLVPVVEVAPKPLEAAHAGECRLEPLDGLERSDPAE